MLDILWDLFSSIFGLLALGALAVVQFLAVPILLYLVWLYGKDFVKKIFKKK